MFPEKVYSLDPHEVIVPNCEYENAKDLYQHEKYHEAECELLKIIDLKPQVHKEETKQHTLLEAYALLGKCFLRTKSFTKLNLWKRDMLDRVFYRGEIPDPIKLVILEQEVITGNPSTVVDSCSEIINEHKEAAGKYTPDFLFMRGRARYFCGNSIGAEEDCEAAYAMYRFWGRYYGAAMAANFLGLVLMKSQAFGDAMRWFNRSLLYFENIDLDRKRSMVLLNFGVSQYKSGMFAKSKKTLEESLNIGINHKWTHRQCFANIALGNVHRLTRDFETARKHLHTAYGQAQDLQMRREEALALEFLGDVYRDEGRPEEARRFYKRAMSIALEIAPEGDIVMEVERRIGECLSLEGEFDLAAEHLTRALQLARNQCDRFEEGVTLRVMAETSLGLGDTESALDTLTSSVDLLEAIGAKHELAISLLRRGELRLMLAGQYPVGRNLGDRSLMLDEAWEDATRALDHLLRIDISWWVEKARNLAERISRSKSLLEKESQAAASVNPSSAAQNIIVHTSGVMRDMIQLCDMFAAVDDPVLICGETGTGKELVARRIHEQSPRRDKPLVTVNVAAISPTLFEREFFGHIKGSFSGADRDGIGFAASADGGTLFLDEIGDLSLDMQPKLLRLIQEGTYQALGDPQTRHANIRLVAATNADFAEMVERGDFRSDLYYRLKVLELNIPAVRHRRDDILPLLRYFLSRAAGRPVEPIEYFNSASIDRLLAYDWPGNVREIAMVSRRAVMEMKAKGRVQLSLEQDNMKKLFLSGPDQRLFGPATVKGKPGSHGRVGAERARILMALEECGGNRIAAARKLGVGRSTLYRRMEKLGIPTRKG